jgi:hypothetical protein
LHCFEIIVIEDELVEVGIKRFDEVELVLLLVLDEEELVVGSAVVVGRRVTPNFLAHDSLSRPILYIITDAPSGKYCCVVEIVRTSGQQ